jgi:outer membrane protein TolC
VLLLGVIVGFLIQALGSAAQAAEPITIPHDTTSQPIKITIEQSVALSKQNYPQLLARIEQARAAKANVTAQTLKEYVPDGLSTWENVAATHNKQTQILFGNPVLPANPGPGENEAKQTWHGTFFNGTGFLFDWTPLDFGLHKARIQEARAQYARSEAIVNVSALDVEVNAALSFMDVIRANEAARAEEANVHRMEVVVRTVQDLFEAGLRPGADVSLAEAQLADARNGLIRAVQQSEIARARLAAAVGEPNQDFDVVEAPIEDDTKPPILLISTPQFTAHPLAVEQRSVIGTILARQKVISKSNYPVIHWLGGLNWRGSGLDTHGQWQKKDAYGWLPREGNWNVGVMMNWNFTDWIKNRQELVVQRHLAEGARKEYLQIIQNLTYQNKQAQAMIKGAIALAENAPIQLHAARQAELRIRTRYETGLSTIAEVAEAERLLTIAQVQAAIARIGVWQALLAASNTRGDIQPFLQQVASARAQERTGM